MSREHQDAGGEKVSGGRGSEREERGGPGSSAVRITTWNGKYPVCLFSFNRCLSSREYLLCSVIYSGLAHPSYIYTPYVLMSESIT